MTTTIAKFVATPRLVLTLIALAIIGGCATNNKSNATATGGKFAFWPPYPNEPRLQYLVSFNRSTDVAPPKSALDELVYGKEKDQALDVNKPYGVAMWNGRIYLCDQRAGYVTVLDLRNRQTLVVGKGSDNLMSPTAIAIAPDGMKYVTDIGKGMVAVFDQNERMVSRFMHKDFKPTGIAVRGEEIYVCNFANLLVEVMNRHTGQVVRTIGQKGTFMRPLGIAVDDSGNVFVTDVLACKILKFDPQGKLVIALSGISPDVGGLVRPKLMAVDKQGTLFVVDAAFENVQLFDQEGHVLTFFGTGGKHPGSMNMPAGIAIHYGDMDLFQKYLHPAFEAERLILVTNQFGSRKVSVYAMGHLKAGKTVADIAASKDVVAAGTASDPRKISPLMSLSGSTTAPSEDSAESPTTQEDAERK